MLVIRYEQNSFHVAATLFVETKAGQVRLGDFWIPNDQWEAIKKEIHAEYIDLDKQEQVVYNTTNEGEESNAK